MPSHLVLASRSPRRKRLLRILGIPFQVEIADIDEGRLEKESPPEFVDRLSAMKAGEIARRRDDVIVIGADTIVVLGEQILEKPITTENAREMLRSLRSRTHTVLTGVTVCGSARGSAGGSAGGSARGSGENIQRGFVEKTLVTFGDISDYQIDSYIASGSPFDKAGGYGIQDDRGALFVERIDGDFYNVMGLPIFRLNQLLRSEFASLFASLHRSGISHGSELIR